MDYWASSLNSAEGEWKNALHTFQQDSDTIREGCAALRSLRSRGKITISNSGGFVPGGGVTGIGFGSADPVELIVHPGGPGGASKWKFTSYERDAESGNVVAEFQGCVTCWIVGYVYLNGQLVAQYRDSTTYFAHKDHLGSTRVLTRVDKSIFDSIDYLPFGEQASGDTGTTHKFTGKERDPESALDYFLARQYASNLGRFLSIDPVAVSREKMKDPQQLNMYAYTRNNPLRYIDPNGEEIRLADLSDLERAKLIAGLEIDTGLDLEYNAKTVNLEIVGQGKGGSETFRKDLTEAINSKDVFNVINASTYGGQRVNFAAFDPKTNTVVIDFKDFSKVTQVNLGLAFYHEAIAHGLKDLPDERPFRESALTRTAKVGRELNVPYPAGHGILQRGDRYYVSIVDPTKKGFDRLRWVDITDVMKERKEK